MLRDCAEQRSGHRHPRGEYIACFVGRRGSGGDSSRSIWNPYTPSVGQVQVGSLYNAVPLGVASEGSGAAGGRVGQVGGVGVAFVAYRPNSVEEIVEGAGESKRLRQSEKLPIRKFDRV